MIEIIHRVNHNDQLNEVPNKYGVEIDIRSNDNKLVLGHDIHKENEDFNYI